MNKVYCKNCQYFKCKPVYMENPKYSCLHPSNEKTRDTWYDILYSYPLKPKKINKNNDCSWYKELVEKKPPKNPNYVDPRERAKRYE